MDLKARIENHKDELVRAAEDSPFIVFLCGPTLKADEPRPSAILRAQLKERLEADGFEVVLGEDEGLEDARVHLGVNAQDNELEFIRNHCNAVIVIADSVGAFCELGLFSWHFVHKNGVIKHSTDFILLVDQAYQTDRSYLNEGPFNAVAGFGQAQFVNLGNYPCDEVITRLKSRRGVFTVDRRGRPRKAKT